MIKKRIFIYGANGFIGSNLKKYLIKKNIGSIAYSRNVKLVDYNNNHYFKFWNNIIKKTNIIVYANFNNDLYELNKNPAVSIYKTLLPLHILFEVIKSSKKKVKVIYLSSASVYGNQKKLPVDENRKTQINNLYDNLKILSEQILINSNIKNLNYTILRLSNVYGENHSKLNQKNRQILSKIIKFAFKFKKINVYGNGRYFRDYIHVKDVCEVILKVMTIKKSNNQIFNIGSGQKVQLISMFKLIQKIILKNYGYSITLNKVKIKKNEMNSERNYQASVIKTKRLLKWKTNIELISGVTNFINFIYKKKLVNLKS